MSLSLCVCDAHRGQERVSAPLEVELDGCESMTDFKLVIFTVFLNHRQFYSEIVTFYVVCLLKEEQQCLIVLLKQKVPCHACLFKKKWYPQITTGVLSR